MKVKQACKGDAYLIRYCDDFVCCFQHENEAEKFYEDLIERFAKFGLEIAVDKTKTLEFRQFAKKNREKKGQGKPETFDFLGFTFYCDTDSCFIDEILNTCEEPYALIGHVRFY